MGFLRIKNDIGTILGLLLTTFFVVACSSNPKIVTMSSSVPEGLSTADVKAAVLEGCNGRGWACKETFYPSLREAWSKQSMALSKRIIFYSLLQVRFMSLAQAI